MSAYDAEPGNNWLLHSDGASRGNPGPSGAGAVLYNPKGEVMAEISRPLGQATNNEAEYAGLIWGLKAALEIGGIKSLTVKMDSELIARQLNGVYRVKNERLRPLYEEAQKLLASFAHYRIVHVRRELNAVADALASRAARKNISERVSG